MPMGAGGGQSRSESSDGSARLLIAEDDMLIALALRAELERIGHEVCGVATSGPRAVDLAERERPDLCLMDVRLAGQTDGIAAAKEIRERFGIQSILMTGHLSREEARTAGVLGWLGKPYTAELADRLVQACLAWLRDGTVNRSISGLFAPVER